MWISIASKSFNNHSIVMTNNSSNNNILSVVLLFLLLIFEFIQQAVQVISCCFWKFWTMLFWPFWQDNRLSLASWALYYRTAFRVTHYKWHSKSMIEFWSKLYNQILLKFYWRTEGVTKEEPFSYGVSV